MSLPVRLNPKTASLHTKLMLTFVIVITLAAALIASVMLDRERKSRYTELEDRADRLVDLASQSMAYSVWNVDTIAIEKYLTSLAKDPEIIKCRISAIGFGKLSEIDKETVEFYDPIIRIKNIIFSTPETGSQKIGEVHIVLTKSYVEAEITEAHRNIWILILSILIMLYIASYILLKKVVSGPVNRLEYMVNRISQGDLNSRCVVETEDELGKLARRVNKMADKLQESDIRLRESEQRLQLVIEGSQLGYWDWNIITGEVVRNEQWAHMLGYTLEEIEFSVKQWTDLQHPEDRAFIEKHLQDHLEGRTTEYEAEYRMRTKTGSYIWILDQARIVSRDENDKPLRMSGTHRDITARKNAEQEKQKLREQLAQSQKMESIGQLAGGMAHDFNNILNGILSASQVLKLPKNGLNERGLKYVDMISQSSMRAADLIKKLLAFSRRSTIENRPLDIHQILFDTTEILKQTIDKKINVTLTEKAEHQRIVGDMSAIESALLNLGINASHAMPEGGELSYMTDNVLLDQDFCDSISFDIKAGTYLRIEVQDSGQGIAKENLQKIFEPFYTTKAPGKGTGLGLSAVYGTVKDHHGAIEVESAIGKGTKFSIYLPNSEESDEVSETKEKIQKGSGTVLLVDDEETLRILNKELIESLGYSVVLASNGLEAIKEYSDRFGEIDIVLMDMIMPVMNGSEAFYKIRKIDDNSKIIIASGFTYDKNIDVLMKAGLKGFIHKPYSVSAISKLLKEVMEEEIK